jgi:hypothetical protein
VLDTGLRLTGGLQVIDLIFVAVALVVFAGSWGLALLCTRLKAGAA